MQIMQLGDTSISQFPPISSMACDDNHFMVSSCIFLWAYIHLLLSRCGQFFLKVQTSVTNVSRLLLLLSLQ
uniref:Uncharacterized protein n=1 Tax=Arundo donax TaxID=35708 RepID=A0A0A8Z6Q5_ARUDO